MAVACQDRSYASSVALPGAGDEVHPLRHGRYVSPPRGEAAAATFAGRRLTLLDRRCPPDSRGERQTVVGETLTPVRFDAPVGMDWTAAVSQGCVPADAGMPAPSARAPSARRRPRLREALSPGSWSAAQPEGGTS